MPSKTKWKEINTKNAKIIFPVEMTENAQEAANLINYVYTLETKTLKSPPKKIPLIIYNTSTVTNGYVGLRPWRTGWYITPSQYATDLNTDYWFYTLAAHEYRHAVQYTHSNKRFTKILSTLFGQTGILMGQYSYPGWFFEGDAVCTETALGNGGRGRIPQFEMGLRTILLSNKKITYDKTKLFSYKEFYPGYYNLGWSLTSYARQQFGAELWNDVISESTKYSFWPFAFSRSLKKNTGLNEKKLFQAALQSLDSVWTKDALSIKETPITIINKTKKKSWTKYTEPHFLNDGSIICKKASLDGDITAFYKINKDGTEKKIKNTDAGMFSVSGNKIVWARTIPDLRWKLRNYSDIIIFDVETKKEKRITKKAKYFAPAISPNGKIIVAVEYNNVMKTSLVFLDAETGKLLNKIESANNDFIRTPTWSANGKNIVYTNTNKVGTALSIINYENSLIKELLPHGHENIGKPIFYKDYIIYNSPYDGIGNIYALNINTKEKYRVISAKFGAYNPQIKDDKMIFINYNAEGYDIAEIELNPENWEEISNIKKYVFERVENLVKQEQGKGVMTSELVPDTIFEVKKYSKVRHSLNFHSWGIDSDLDSKIGANLYTANVLNTVFGIANAYYDVNEERFSTNVITRFSRFYPVIDIIGGYAQRNVYYSSLEENDEWTEFKGKFNLSLPLDFSRGIYRRGANISTGYIYTHKIDKEFRYLSESGNGNFSSLQYTASIYNFRKQALRDINPKFGQFLYVTYKNTPFKQVNEGYQFSILGSVYFPGILKHHSLNIKAGYENQRTYDAFDYWFSSPQNFPRGYDFVGFEELKQANVDYDFPVFYPEFNIGPLVYFTRLRAGIFYDYAYLRLLGESNTTNYQSVGLESYLQFYVFRLENPFEIGGRISYLLDGSNVIDYQFITFRIPF